MDEDNSPELPSDELIWRVTATRSREWFWDTGSRSINEINAVLSVLGTSIKDYSRVLDWGCGCGRILLHLQEVGQKAELYGVDIDAEAIAWAQRHIPWARCSVCDGLPPLDFPNNFFDLIYNHSVMTHLDEQYQDAWLAELQRVIKPEGIVLLTVSGNHPFAGLEKTWREAGANPAPLRETLRKKGILYIADDHWKGGPFPDFYHSTFHAPWYIFEHWGQFFEIKAYIVRGSVDFQDFVLMRRHSNETYLEHKNLKLNTVNAASSYNSNSRKQRVNVSPTKKLLLTMLHRDPNNIDILLDLAEICIEEDNVEQATEYLSSILKLEPNNEEALENLRVLQDKIAKSHSDSLNK